MIWLLPLKLWLEYNKSNINKKAILNRLGAILVLVIYILIIIYVRYNISLQIKLFILSKNSNGFTNLTPLRCIHSQCKYEYISCRELSMASGCSHFHSMMFIIRLCPYQIISNGFILRWIQAMPQVVDAFTMPFISHWL